MLRYGPVALLPILVALGVGRPLGSLGLFQFYAIRVLHNDEMAYICTWKVRGKGLKCMTAWKLTLAQHH